MGEALINLLKHDYRILIFAGWLFEETGGYNVSFILAGALITLSGVMLLSIKCQGCGKK